MHSHEANGNGGGGAAPGGLGQWWPGSRAALAWLAVSVVLAAAFLTISVAAFRGTAERTERVEQLAYEHRGTFEYAVETQPSRLYPEGRIEPVVLEDGSITLPQPIYTQLARTMTVDFAYDLASDLPPDVSGELGIDLVIRAGDGWRQTETLLAPRPFEGDAAIGSVTLDFAAIGALVESIETETGFAPATYTLSVQPRVSVYGTLGSNPIEETYAPTFELLYGDTQITPPETLATAEPVSLGDDVQRANEMTLLGLGLTVRSWRWIGAAGSLLALSVAGGIAAFALLGLGRDEEARIQARYRSMLVPVESNGSHASDRSIHVHSMRHLARLAQRDGGIIFHEAGPYLHRYFVRDGEDTYDYTIRSGESGPYGPHARAVHGRADEPHGALGAAARDQ